MAKCSKVRYSYAWQAKRALKRVDNAGLGLYHCQSCGGYHLGREKSRAADRITQLLKN